MKAMVLKQQKPIYDKPLELSELTRPDPDDDEVLIKVSCCGICHTDLHIIEGELPLKRNPLIPGHQIVGTVKGKGMHVKHLNVGDRVGVAWLNSTCGSCNFCRTGQENLCKSAQFTGHDVNGGFAEYITVKEDYVYPIPEGLSDIEAAPLLCAGIIGYRALRLSNVERGQRLGIYGFGASAHVTIQVANYLGIDVFVFSHGVEHRELASKFSAVWTGEYSDVPEFKMDGSIIFAPSGDLVPVALANLQHGGTVALAGIYMTDIPMLNYERHLYHEKILRSVTASTRRDGRELIDVAARIPIRTKVQAFDLSEANEALILLKDRAIVGAGVLKVNEIS
ncbi:MAG: zinc-dependent alcohol dehydrogenase family protein [Actinobacteria bacterium]|nr:zinc-dependent alcohol dehydrogenase family protein [Actinomycetota bacterium]